MESNTDPTKACCLAIEIPHATYRTDITFVNIFFYSSHFLLMIENCILHIKFTEAVDRYTRLSSPILVGLGSIEKETGFRTKGQIQNVYLKKNTIITHSSH